MASILDFIAIADENGNLNQEILQNLQNIQDYLDPLIPLEIAEDFIEDIFKDYSKDSTFKLAILRILHFYYTFFRSTQYISKHIGKRIEKLVWTIYLIDIISNVFVNLARKIGL